LGKCGDNQNTFSIPTYRNSRALIHSNVYSFTHLFIPCSLFRQVNKHFQRDFSTEGYLVLPFSISCILSYFFKSSSSFLRILPLLTFTSTLPSLFPP
jgi:hypothetical protein